MLPDSLLAAFGREVVHLETSPLEVLGFVTTLLNVWLLAKNRVLGWPVGLVAIAAYAVVFFDAKLYADTLLQGIFFVSGLWGWYDWLHGGQNRTPLPISRLSALGWATSLVWIAVASLGVGAFFAAYTDAARPFLDSALTGGSIVAQLLLMRRILDNWLLWIALDVLYVPLYLSRGLPLTALLYAGLVVLAWRGYVGWQRERAAEAAALSASPPA